ncbi:hypothetical protein [Eubacterium sp. AB3007]|nr:hypothetical protein [Eubacterium sp. AB3007]
MAIRSTKTAPEIGAQKAGMELSDYRKAMAEYRKKAASTVSDNTRKP